MADLHLKELTFRPYRAKAGQLVAASSYLIDRFVPDCEIIALPPKDVGGGVLRYGRGPLPAPTAPSGLRGLLKARARPGRVTGTPDVFDFRLRTPQNWAHFLNNHLPIFFRLCTELGVPITRAQIVLPQNTPGYIQQAAALFGLNLVLTDDTLEGEGILFAADPWTGIRAVRADWVRIPAVMDRLAALPKVDAIPSRVFLSRKDTRVISNVVEVEAWLARRGFVTLYPEELSAADQFRLFREAETIVAVHGAGLAPLLYRPADSALRQLVEILPCGHMTDVYRVMADQVGCDWIGVRGRIKPEYVTPAYDLGAGFTAFSLDAFEVDITALERAFAMAAHPIEEI